MRVSSPDKEAVPAPPIRAGTAGLLSQEPGAASQPRRVASNAFFHCTMTGLALLFVVGSIVGLRLTRTTVPLGQILPRLVLLAILLAGAAFYRWRRLPKAVNLIMMTVWAFVFGYLHIVPMFIAARSRVPLRDDWLARLDATLGVQVPDVLRFMEPFPRLRNVLFFSYWTLHILITLVIMVPPMCDRMRAAKQFALGSVVAALICLPIFGAFQARGPWGYYGYTPATDQANYERVFEDIKSQDEYVLDLGYRDGLICFPSFHAILAVLAGTALWSIPYLRWPAVILAGLIVVSTVTTGTHYIVDVVAGLLIAAVSCLVVKGYSHLEVRLAYSGCVGDNVMPQK